jgi:hypothetical protein
MKKNIKSIIISFGYIVESNDRFTKLKFIPFDELQQDDLAWDT